MQFYGSPVSYVSADLRNCSSTLSQLIIPRETDGPQYHALYPSTYHPKTNTRKKASPSSVLLYPTAAVISTSHDRTYLYISYQYPTYDSTTTYHIPHTLNHTITITVLFGPLIREPTLTGRERLFAIRFWRGRLSPSLFPFLICF
jgi:hypothetical protein